MKRFGLGTYALSGSVAVALLAGCGGSQPPIGVPSTMPQTSANTTHADRGKSWMLPDAKNEDLLYVANLDNGVGFVDVYTYPQMKLVGKLKGFSRPNGECVDKAGNVFVVDFYDQNIAEYPHGGTKLIEVLADNGSPFGCAIDPTTGDLAVMNWCDGPDGSCYAAGTVLIYKKAKGFPEVLTDNVTAFMYYGSYDDRGNLFVDGSNSVYNIGFSELPRGDSSFQSLPISLPKHPQAPGGVQWHGKDLAVTAVNGNVIYEYRIKRLKPIRVSSTLLKGVPWEFGTNQFFIFGNDVIAPVLSTMKYPNGTTNLFHYPAGGAPIKVVTKAVNSPYAAAVSLAK
jgi:hypothetical protein